VSAYNFTRGVTECLGLQYSWLPDVFRLKGSVCLILRINLLPFRDGGIAKIVARIWGPILTVTLFAALVCYAWSKGTYIKLTNSVVPLLSVVVGIAHVDSHQLVLNGPACS
jgi:putative membrane protein